jgi:hypothetical protein
VNLPYTGYLTFKVPNLLSLFRCLGRIKVSVQVRGFVCECFVTEIRFHSEGSCQSLAQHPSWWTTPFRLSATVYSIYSQLASILEAVSPSATRGMVSLTINREQSITIRARYTQQNCVRVVPPEDEQVMPETCRVFEI